LNTAVDTTAIVGDTYAERMSFTTFVRSGAYSNEDVNTPWWQQLLIPGVVSIAQEGADSVGQYDFAWNNEMGLSTDMLSSSSDCAEPGACAPSQ
jgi:hypothetical protein